MPLIRLAMAVGLDKVAATAHRMGIESEVAAGPRAGSGLRRGDAARDRDRLRDPRERRRAPRPARARRRARSARASPSPSRKPKKPERVVTPQVAYITTTVLEGVVERGDGPRGAALRHPRPAGGQDGDDQRGARQLVRRLPARPRDHRLGGAGQPRRHHPLRLAGGPPHLGALHEGRPPRRRRCRVPRARRPGARRHLPRQRPARPADLPLAASTRSSSPARSPPRSATCGTSRASRRASRISASASATGSRGSWRGC